MKTLPDARELSDAVPTRVAETMRRVHEQLAQGLTPSFEALLALGEPSR